MRRIRQRGVRAGDRKKVALADDLEALDAQQVRLVEARFFGGLSVEETAEYLDFSPTSVRRHWRRARAWLYSKLSPARN
ncbi:MAG: ECF-type sigma factor [Thermoanaerobaculia bacterium]|nr:ECF-type sigma factor [Thermoanaerobaculia bacterium]